MDLPLVHLYIKGEFIKYYFKVGFLGERSYGHWLIRSIRIISFPTLPKAIPDRM